MKPKPVQLSLGTSEDSQKVVDDLTEVQKQIEEMTYMKVTRVNALRVLIAHWQKTKGDQP